MMKNKVLNNIFLIALPALPIATIITINAIFESAQKTYEPDFVGLYLMVLIYCLLLVLLMYAFLVKKRTFSIIALSIGLLELVVILIPAISVKVGGFILTGSIFLYIFAPFTSIYTLLFVMYFIDKNKIISTKDLVDFDK